MGAVMVLCECGRDHLPALWRGMYYDGLMNLIAVMLMARAHGWEPKP